MHDFITATPNVTRMDMVCACLLHALTTFVHASYELEDGDWGHPPSKPRSWHHQAPGQSVLTHGSIGCTIHTISAAGYRNDRCS